MTETTLEYPTKLIIYSILSVTLLIPLPLFSQVPFGHEDIFSSVPSSRKIQAGENLQLIAEAAYGDPLFWPFVWILNSKELPDPEKITTGDLLMVPRLLVGNSDTGTRQSLSEAYKMVYQQYLSLPSRTLGERRWVLGQAASAGVDITLWGESVEISDRVWGKKNLKIPSPLPPFNPVEALEGRETSSSFQGNSLPGAGNNWEQKILSGDPVSLHQVEIWVQSELREPGIQDLLGRLEQASDHPKAPPQISFALSIFYGRQGYREREYTALQRARIAALRRPDVIFNLMLVYGRMNLLHPDGIPDTPAPESPAYPTPLPTASKDVVFQPDAELPAEAGSPSGKKVPNQSLEGEFQKPQAAFSEPVEDTRPGFDLYSKSSALISYGLLGGFGAQFVMDEVLTFGASLDFTLNPGAEWKMAGITQAFMKLYLHNLREGGVFFKLAFAYGRIERLKPVLAAGYTAMGAIMSLGYRFNLPGSKSSGGPLFLEAELEGLSLITAAPTVSGSFFYPAPGLSAAFSLLLGWDFPPLGPSTED